jgi:hypothetical protein
MNGICFARGCRVHRPLAVAPVDGTVSICSLAR